MAAFINESFVQCRLLSVIKRKYSYINKYVESTRGIHNIWTEKIIAEVDGCFETVP